MKAFEVKEQAARALEKLDRELNDKEAELRREEESAAHARERELAVRRADDEGVEPARSGRGAPRSAEHGLRALPVEGEVRGRARGARAHAAEASRQPADVDPRAFAATPRSGWSPLRSRLEAQKAVSRSGRRPQPRRPGRRGRSAQHRVHGGGRRRVGAGCACRRSRSTRSASRTLRPCRPRRPRRWPRVRLREQKMIQHFKEKYGIDPTESSFFHYADQPAPTPGGSPKGTF